MAQKHCTSKKRKIIKIDEEQVMAHVGDVVRGAVEETLNTLLSEEVDQTNRGTERHESWALYIPKH